MPKCTIESVQRLSKDKLNPVIVNFQNATPSEEDHEVRYVVDKHKKMGILIDYKGNVNTSYYGRIGDGYPTDLVDTYLAIRNPETNKIRFVEVEQVSLLSQHYIKNPHESDTRHIDAKTLLYKNFGSKSAVRAMDKKEKTEFNPDIMKSKLDETVEEIDESGLNEDISQEDEDVCPRKNKEAKKLEEVYDIDEIIPPEIMTHLEDPAYKLLETKPLHLPFTTPFLLGCVKELQMCKEPDSPNNIQKLKICLYMDGLVNLINSKAKMMSKVEISKVSEKLSNYIREAFTPQGAKNTIKTKYTKQKALCHFLVLAFFLSKNYELSIANLIEGVSISKKEIVRYVTFIGASQKLKTGTIQLKLPKDTVSTPGGSSFRKYKKRS